MKTNFAGFSFILLETVQFCILNCYINLRSFGWIVPNYRDNTCFELSMILLFTNFPDLDFNYECHISGCSLKKMNGACDIQRYGFWQRSFIESSNVLYS